MIDVLCVGTPDVHGDAVGPLVGSMLSQLNLDVNIVGTVNDPVIRSNYYEQLKRLRPGAHIIVVDAIVGKDVGTYSIEEGSIAPGEAMNTGIPAIGDTAVKCTMASTVFEMTFTDPWLVSMMAYTVTTELTDMLKTTKIKEIYRDKNKIKEKML